MNDFVVSRSSCDDPRDLKVFYSEPVASVPHYIVGTFVYSVGEVCLLLITEQHSPYLFHSSCYCFRICFEG